VVSLGGSTKHGEFYGEDLKRRKERKSGEADKEVQILKQQVAQIPQICENIERKMSEEIDQKVDDKLAQWMTAILPDIVAGIARWMDGGRQGPLPVPSMVGSNSNNVAPAVLVTPQPTTMAPQVLVTPPPTNAGPQVVVTPAAGTAPSSSHSIMCTPGAVGSPSTLAELEAIKVPN
jgi:hypothetical protein